MGVPAVLFLTYKRLHTSEAVFQAIRSARPPRLYFASNAPAMEDPEERRRVDEVRALLQRVDWECDVHPLFRGAYLPVKASISSSIAWFFEHETEGIILEDDCVPHPTFFRFCGEMLDRFRHDQRVSMISGDNFQFGHRENRDSYYFSGFQHIWGWATWRDRWQVDYDVAMKRWPGVRDGGRIADLFCSRAEQVHWAMIFEKVYQGEIDTWDYQWFFACRLNGRLSVMPCVNMVSNIGFGAGAVHTQGASRLANMVVEEMPFPLEHPETVFCSRRLDRRYFDAFCKPGLAGRAKAVARRMVRP